MLYKGILSFFVLFVVLTSHLFAADEDDTYYKEAGQYYDINHVLLKAIAQTESKQNPYALNCANRNGSCDYGIMQINSTHLPMLNKNGISVRDLFDKKTNIFVGAWVLKGCINKYGVSYKSLNCYNGRIVGNDYYVRVLNSYWKFAQELKGETKKRAMMYAQSEN